MANASFLEHLSNGGYMLCEYMKYGSPATDSLRGKTDCRNAVSGVDLTKGVKGRIQTVNR